MRTTIMRLLDDKSSDVSTIAVKWCVRPGAAPTAPALHVADHRVPAHSLGVLMQKFSLDECKLVVNKLGALVVDPSKSASRDTWAGALARSLPPTPAYSMHNGKPRTGGLKSIIGNIREEYGREIATEVVKELIKGERGPPARLVPRPPPTEPPPTTRPEARRVQGRQRRRSRGSNRGAHDCARHPQGPPGALRSRHDRHAPPRLGVRP
jgi:hypothetical protein